MNKNDSGIRMNKMNGGIRMNKNEWRDPNE